MKLRKANLSNLPPELQTKLKKGTIISTAIIVIGSISVELIGLILGLPSFERFIMTLIPLFIVTFFLKYYYKKDSKQFISIGNSSSLILKHYKHQAKNMKHENLRNENDKQIVKPNTVKNDIAYDNSFDDHLYKENS
ncbi:MAG: hypothetical protein ACYDAO_07020 [Thermoplasmataceae archaeon]